MCYYKLKNQTHVKSLYNILKESLLRNFDDLEVSIDPKKDIEQFINNNYKTQGKLQISKEPNENGKYVVNCNSTVEVTNRNITSLTNNLFEWGEVGGEFNCIDCDSLASLEGAPEKVSGQFKCNYCESLTSLEGAPEEVDGYFSCNDCKNLTSLKGAPKKIRTDFSCDFCISLKSLEGAPEKINWSFVCSYCKSLKTLKGAPKEVGVAFNCANCESLISLEGAPKKIGEIFCCINCGIKFKKPDIKKLISVGGKIQN